MAKKICPRCGGNNTAKIFWGMPIMTPELKTELDSKNVVLGGCCMSVPCPTHHCFDCDKDVFYDTSEERVSTVYFEFQISGFFGGNNTLVVENREGVFLASVELGVMDPDGAIKKELTFQEYCDFINKIYNCYILEWDEEYVNLCVLDGTQWHMIVRGSSGKEIKCYGSNAYPPMWKKFLKAVNSLDLPIIR